jgi:hypothetical protein
MEDKNFCVVMKEGWGHKAMFFTNYKDAKEFKDSIHEDDEPEIFLSEKLATKVFLWRGSS